MYSVKTKEFGVSEDKKSLRVPVFWRQEESESPEIESLKTKIVWNPCNGITKDNKIVWNPCNRVTEDKISLESLS